MPVDPVTEVLGLLAARPPTLGGGRLLCVDGPSGSGKTTFATRLARRAPESRVVHMDAMYDGWDGLARVDEQLETLLAPLALDRPGSYQRYDWHAARYAGAVTVPPRPLLILEGVGSWSPAYRALVTVLVWVQAPADERLARALARDGADMEPRLREWAVSEQQHFARAATRAHADREI